MAVSNGRKYRGRDIIVGAILEAAQSGATRTKIMCDAYISFYQCGTYLHELQSAGLICCDDDNIWGLTQKGVELMMQLRRVSELMQPATILH